MRTVVGFVAGCLAGAGVVVVGFTLVYGLAWYHMAIGLGLLVGACFMAGWLDETRQTFEAKPGVLSAGVDAEKYAELLSKLEIVRSRQNLPETVYIKLQEEYVQRLKTALEKDVLD